MNFMEEIQHSACTYIHAEYTSKYFMHIILYYACMYTYII